MAETARPVPSPVPEVVTEAPPHVNEFKRVLKVFFGRKLVIVGFVFVVLAVIAAFFAPVLAPYDPYKMTLPDALHQPGAKYLLGTDEFGRDLLSRIIWGARVSMFVSLSVTAIAGSIGMSLGLIAGYFGGKVFAIIMRSMDALIAFPNLLLMLLIVSLLGGGMRNLIIALTIAMIPASARMMTGQVLSIKQNDYVLAGRAMGAGNIRIMLRHLFPNAFAPLLILLTTELGLVIIMEASLSFLGLGVGPPTPTWGNMVNEGRPYLLTNPWFALTPGFAIVMVVFGYMIMGDGLRDALDPRLRGTL